MKVPSRYKDTAQNKSYLFALTVVKSCMRIQKSEREYVITKQLIRSSTSVGANLQEAIGRQSAKDLLHKIQIADKEARESKYWLFMLYDLELMGKEENDRLLTMNEELLRILGASTRTLKSRLNR